MAKASNGAKGAKKADLRETRDIVLAAKRYYETVIADHEKRLADVDGRIDKLLAEKRKLEEDFAAAPAKIEQFERQLKQLDAEATKTELDPKLARLAKLRSEMEKLIGQNLGEVGDWSQIEALLKPGT
jgi:chromosome segregation ATPase